MLSDGKSSSCQNNMCQPISRSPSIQQQGLHVFLKAEIAKLCKALKLSEDVEHTVQRILEHLIETCHVNEDNMHLLQAFQMSLCWIAADILGQQMDRKVFCLEARKMLNFGCPDELADAVYQKLVPMKKTFEQLPAKITDSVLWTNVVSPVGDIAVCSSTSKEPRVKAEVEYISSLNPDLEQYQELKEKAAVTVNEKKLRKKICKKRKLKLYQKHEQEIEEFEKIWKEKRGNPVPVEPLQKELEKIDKEREQVVKLLEENKLQLNSEYQKEIEELAIKIRQKYLAKLRDTEAPILAKKTEIELKKNAIFMHKRLAEAARSKCLDFRPIAHAPVPVEPLQKELEKIDKEREQVIKLLEENNLQLKSECEKQIDDLAVQIRLKYVAKLQDTEAPILAKKTEIELKKNAIFMHKRLAEAARSKCLDSSLTS